MQLTPKPPTVKGPADWFTGEVWIDNVGAVQERLNLLSVHFTPGARTAWHSHDGGQTLYVTEGHGLVQSRGEPVVKVHAGDVVHTPAGEEHWHGAAAEHFMTHLALTGGDASWGAHVTDEEYRSEG